MQYLVYPVLFLTIWVSLYAAMRIIVFLARTYNGQGAEFAKWEIFLLAASWWALISLLWIPSR